MYTIHGVIQVKMLSKGLFWEVPDAVPFNNSIHSHSLKKWTIFIETLKPFLPFW